MKRIIRQALVALLIPMALLAQEPTEESGATGGYDPAVGLYFSDPEAGFVLSLGAYAQFRYNMNWRENQPDSVASFSRGFSLTRTEIFLSGSYTDLLDFHIRTQIRDGTTFELYAAWARFNISDTWNLTVGKQFIPISREDWMYAQDLLAIDYSANDNTFAVGTSLGLVLNAQWRKTRLWLGADDGAFSAKSDSTQVPPSDILVSGRFEWQVAGEDWAVWDDLIGRRGRPFGVLIGVAPSALFRADNDVQFKNEQQFNLDVSVNGDGYHVLVAGSVTNLNPVLEAGYYNWGLYAQGGYFVSDEWQLYGRYDFVSPGDQPPLRLTDLENFSALGAGMNWLPFKTTNRWKISAEVGYLFSALNRTIVQATETLGWLPSDTKGQTLVRLQAQFGF